MIIKKVYGKLQTNCYKLSFVQLVVCFFFSLLYLTLLRFVVIILCSWKAFFPVFLFHLNPWIHTFLPTERQNTHSYYQKANIKIREWAVIVCVFFILIECSARYEIALQCLFRRIWKFRFKLPIVCRIVKIVNEYQEIGWLVFASWFFFCVLWCIHLVE